MQADLRKVVALIDPVGIKAGMDHYDLLLAGGLVAAGTRVVLFSNFEKEAVGITARKVFFNTGVTKWKAIWSNFSGHLRAFRTCKKEGISWIIVHVFRAGLFDLVVFTIARLMGLKLCTILHDIESLDTVSLPFIRNRVMHRLPHQRVVHNEYSKAALTGQPGDTGRPTAVIPHVHFRHLFEKYGQDPALLEKLRHNDAIAGRLHPRLLTARQEGKPILLFFGQIKKAKGLDVFLEALRQTPDDCVAVIAGKVRNERWSRYEDLITSLNIRNKVIPVIRHITDEERDFLFAACTAIVLPYTHIYQSGVLLMAMSFPLTVIASDLPPNRELLVHEHNGLLFTSGNAGQLATQLQTLLQKATDPQRLQQQALRDIAVRYSPVSIGKRFDEVLFGSSLDGGESNQTTLEDQQQETQMPGAV